MTIDEACRRIEELEQENARLRAALSDVIQTVTATAHELARLADDGSPNVDEEEDQP